MFALDQLFYICSTTKNKCSVAFAYSTFEKQLTFVLQEGKVIPKRKQWSTEQTRGPKRVKAEVKSTQTEEAQCLTDGMSNEAYELMVVGRNL